MMQETERASACPDDELLAAYIERRLDEARQEVVERHVAACALCADVVAASLAAVDEAREVVPALPPAAPPRAGSPFRARRLALAASLVLSTSALGYAGADLLLTALRGGIAATASSVTGAPVTIEGVGFSLALGPSLRLRLDDVRIATRPPMAAARVEITTALAALVRGELAIETVQLIRPLLQVGDPPPAAPGAAPPPRQFDLGGSGAILALLARGAVDIHDGTFVAKAMDNTRLTITQVNGTAHARQDGVAIAFSGALAGGRVTATGTIPPEASGELSVTIAGAELALAALPYSRGRASGVTTLRLAVGGSPAVPVLRGQLQIAGARVQGWNPLPALLDPPSAPGLLAAISPRLATPDLALDDVRVRFAAQRGSLRIQHASFAAAQARGDGSLRVHRDGVLHGGGHLALPPTLSQALLVQVPTLGVPGAGGRLVLPFGVDGSLATPRFVLR